VACGKKSCGKKLKRAVPNGTALFFPLADYSQPGFSRHLRPELQCAAGFFLGGAFGAAFTSKAPSFIVITNGFAT
jgi:hypothetical protein